jgi:hypothetical protein
LPGWRASVAAAVRVLHAFQSSVVSSLIVLTVNVAIAGLVVVPACPHPSCRRLQGVRLLRQCIIRLGCMELPRLLPAQNARCLIYSSSAMLQVVLRVSGSGLKLAYKFMHEFIDKNRGMIPVCWVHPETSELAQTRIGGALNEVSKNTLDETA